jgi:hypothetical protein
MGGRRMKRRRRRGKRRRRKGRRQRTKRRVLVVDVNVNRTPSTPTSTH